MNSHEKKTNASDKTQKCRRDVRYQGARLASIRVITNVWRCLRSGGKMFVHINDGRRAKKYDKKIFQIEHAIFAQGRFPYGSSVSRRRYARQSQSVEIARARSVVVSTFTTNTTPLELTFFMDVHCAQPCATTYARNPFGPLSKTVYISRLGTGPKRLDAFEIHT